MKLIPVRELIKDKSLLLIDDSIVRGTQLSQTTEFLYDSGAKEVHIRPACPPLLYGCKYLNFSRSNSEHGSDHPPGHSETGRYYYRSNSGRLFNPDSHNYQGMLDEIGKQLKFTTLRYHRLDDMVASIGFISL